MISRAPKRQIWRGCTGPRLRVASTSSLWPGEDVAEGFERTSVVTGRGVVGVETPVDEANERFGREPYVGRLGSGGGIEGHSVGSQRDSESTIGVGRRDGDGGRL